LTKLDLLHCSSLTTLSEGLGNLNSLTKLDLWECSSLTVLPKGLGNLTSLTELDLLRCSSLTTLPEGLGNLISLAHLHPLLPPRTPRGLCENLGPFFFLGQQLFVKKNYTDVREAHYNPTKESD
jgi:hypothetical protein